MAMKGRHLFLAGAILLMIGVVALWLTKGSNFNRSIALRMLEAHKDTNGQWLATFIVTNGSERLMPTFAATSPPGFSVLPVPMPTNGDPVCWFEPKKDKVGCLRPGPLNYFRILNPTSSWCFETKLELSNPPQRLVLAYVVCRGHLPKVVETFLVKYYRVFSWPPPWIFARFRYVTCDLPVGDLLEAHTFSNEGITRRFETNAQR